MKKGLGNEKRGLSTIIVTLIIILISLVAIGVFWVVVNNLIQGNTENIGLEKLTLNTKILAVQIDNSSNNLTLSVKRNVGEGNLVGMKFVFYNGSNTEVLTEDFELEQLGERQFIFHLNINVSTLLTISIVPLFPSGKGEENLGNIADTYDVKTGKRIEPLPSGSCVPSTCSPTDCDTHQNGTCGTMLDCGDCDSGYNCVDGTCQAITCTPNCVGKDCGDDGCGGSCGTCITGTCNSTGQCVVTSSPSDLIALYHFDRNTSVGENDIFVYDWSENGNGCNVTGSVYTASGRTNGAYSFDGYGDYIFCGNHSSLTPDNYITIAFWAWANEINNASDRYFLYKTQSYFIDATRTYSNRSHAYVYNDTASGSYTFPIIETDRWIHFALTYNGSNLRVFLNGTLVGNNALQGAIRKNPSPLIVGAMTNNPTNARSFNGTIDEMRIYNRALSDAEIQALYNSY